MFEFNVDRVCHHTHEKYATQYHVLHLTVLTIQTPGWDAFEKHMCFEDGFEARTRLPGPITRASESELHGKMNPRCNALDHHVHT